MKSFLDNTGLQSTALVLAGNARGPEDVREFMQLLILLVFSESLVVGGFELPEVAEKTAAAVERIVSSGLPDTALRVATISEWNFASACLRAALHCAEDFPVAFAPENNRSFHLYPAGLKPESLLKRAALLGRVLDPRLPHGKLSEIANEAIQQRKAGAVAFMLAGSETLRERILESIDKTSELTVGYLNELEAFCRVYLNDELARRESSLYAPAVARARRLREGKAQLIARLSDVIDDVVSEMRILPLTIPALQPSWLAAGIPTLLECWRKRLLYVQRRAQSANGWLPWWQVMATHRPKYEMSTF